MRTTPNKMLRWVGGVILVLCVTLASSAKAEQLGNREASEQFCAGFSRGWISVKGTTTIVPICPVTPIIPTSSTYFDAGFKAGALAAKRR